MSEQTTPIRGNRSGAGWHLQPGRRYFMIAIALLGAAVLIGPGIGAALQGKLVAAVLCIMIGLALLALPFGGTRRRLPARAWTDGTTRGVLLAMHPTKVITIAALGLLGVVLAAAGAVIAFQGVRAGTYGQLVGAGISSGIGVFMLVGAYAGVRSRMAADRGIVLTPGAVLLRTRRDPLTIRWEDLVAVRAHWRRRVRGAFGSVDEQIHNWLTLDVRPGVAPGPDALATMSGTDQPSVDAAALAVDPHVVLALLRFYLEQPDRRAELATDAALARVAELERGLVTSAPR